MGEEIRAAERLLPDGETKLQQEAEEEEDSVASLSQPQSWTAERDEEEQDLEAHLSKSQSWRAGGDDSDQKEAMQPLLSQAPSSTSPGVESKNERLASLDVFRGLTVAAMILVDYGGGLWSGINHSPWNGVTFADFVVPAFLFIVGVSLTLTYKTQQDRRFTTFNVILRVLKLFGLGLILQGGYIHSLGDLSYGVDIQLLRIMGVLQRIAVAYAIVALFEVFSSKSYIADTNETFSSIVKIYIWQWVAALLIIGVYTGLLYGLYVPSWKFEAPSNLSFVNLNTSSTASSLLLVKCNVRGSLSPGCNAVGFVDRAVMGLSHLYRHPAYRRSEECSVDSPYDGPLPDNAPTWCLAPFDPEGILSSLPAVVTCFIGAHCGHVLVHMKGHKRHLSHWTISGSVLVVLGLLIEAAGMPLNKQLYTLSYMFLTAGAAALVFSAIFVLVDVYKWRSSTALFKWIGAHSLMIYALFACGVLPIALQGIYWKYPENNIIQIILKVLGI